MVLEAELVQVLVEWEEESELVAAWELELVLEKVLASALVVLDCHNRCCLHTL